MYKLLLFFIIILAILYTIDNKPLNIVIDFILIIINISILLFYIDIIDLSFFSFILIIIYASALAILFGLIMMLFNNVSLSFGSLSSWPSRSLDNSAQPATNIVSSHHQFLFPLKLIFACDTRHSIPTVKLPLPAKLAINKYSLKLYIFFTFLCLVLSAIFYFYLSTRIGETLLTKAMLLTNVFYNIPTKLDSFSWEVSSFHEQLNIIKIIFSNIYYNNYINILIIIIILLISLIGIIFLLI